MKYSNEIADKIIELVSTGDHTIADICKAVDISKDTYYDWKNNKSDFSASLKRADEQRLQAIGELAKSGLAILLTKHEYEEITTEYTEGKDGKPKIKTQKKVKKFIMPNTAAVIFALINRKSEDWKQKQSIEHSGEIKLGKELADETYE